MILFSSIRSLVGMLIFVFWTAYNCLILMSYVWRKPERATIDMRVGRWARGTLRIFNIHVKEIGRENIPDKGCLYLFNHTSFLDIFVLNGKIQRMRFGAKIELFSIPLFGRAMTAASALPIARSEPEKVFKIYEKAIERVNVGGEQFILSPEGGRSDSEALRPFKAGPFLFAIQGKIPLVPVVLIGCREVWPKNSIAPNWRRWKTTIVVRYLPPVDTSSYQTQNRNELQKLIFAQMTDAINELKSANP